MGFDTASLGHAAADAAWNHTNSSMDYYHNATAGDYYGHDDESESGNWFSDNMALPYFFLLIIVIMSCCKAAVHGCTIRVESVRFDAAVDDSRGGNGSFGNGDGKRNYKLSLADKIYRMTPEERLCYYEEVITANGNYTTLTSNQIISLEEDVENGPDDGDGDDDEDEDQSLYLTLDNIWNSAREKSSQFFGGVTAGQMDTTGDEEDNNAHQSTRSTSLVVLNDDDDDNAARQSCGGGTTTTTSKRRGIVRGNCVICFENFEAGDTIVYSKETKHCPHVYHKECYVQYCAGRKISVNESRKHGEEAFHPACPTCRQPFCELIPLKDEDNAESITGSDTVSSSGSSSSSESPQHHVQIDNEDEEGSFVGSSEIASSINNSNDETNDIESQPVAEISEIATNEISTNEISTRQRHNEGNHHQTSRTIGFGS